MADGNEFVPVLSHPLADPCPVSRWTKGLYRIRNTKSGEFYVGQSRCLKARRNGHLHELRRGRHHSRNLQASFDRDGVAAFVFEVLSMSPPKWGAMGRPLGRYVKSGLGGVESEAIASLSPGLNMPPRKGRKFGPRKR